MRYNVSHRPAATSRAGGDEEQPVQRKDEAEGVDAAGEHRGHADGMLLASPDKLGCVAEDEDEREGEQQLHLVRFAVDPPQ